jgi:hypothetical protein
MVRTVHRANRGEFRTVGRERNAASFGASL